MSLRGTFAERLEEKQSQSLRLLRSSLRTVNIFVRLLSDSYIHEVQNIELTADEDR
jgi:hypothetical protein